jgi:hypothetical protein
MPPRCRLSPAHRRAVNPVGPPPNPVLEVVQAWWVALPHASVGMGVAFAFCLAVLGACWSDPSPVPRRVGWAVFAVYALVGLTLAVRRVSLVDDAFFSFRYAENWSEGRGLVFNVGERVEGYTNLLWVCALALVAKLTPLRPHWTALVLGLACFVGNLAVVARLGERLHGGSGRWLPVGAALLAVHGTMTDFATTGLETAGVSLLVDAGALALVSGRAGWAGVWFVLATLTRPDAALAWVAGAFALARSDTPRGAWARYVAPWSGFALVLAAKWAYYGSVVPNAFYVRAAGEAHVAQGALYAWVWLVGSNALLVAGVAAALLLRGSTADAPRGWTRFALAYVALHGAYVVWVGGDYIHGRFFVVLLPVLALLAEHALLARATGGWAAAGLGAGLVAAGTGVAVVPPHTVRWGIADEPTFSETGPEVLLDMDTALDTRARYAFQTLVEAGFPLTIEGTGGFAYRTHARVVESCGLVDPDVRERVHGEGMAGHQACLDRAALVDRGVRLSFTRNVFAMGADGSLPRVGQRPIDALCDPGVCVHVIAYDDAWMHALHAADPGVAYVDLPTHADAALAGVDAARAALARYLDAVYFPYNADGRQLAWQGVARDRASGAPIPDRGDGAGMSGFRARMRSSP